MPVAGFKFDSSERRKSSEEWSSDDKTTSQARRRAASHIRYSLAEVCDAELKSKS